MDVALDVCRTCCLRPAVLHHAAPAVEALSWARSDPDMLLPVAVSLMVVVVVVVGGGSGGDRWCWYFRALDNSLGGQPDSRHWLLHFKRTCNELSVLGIHHSQLHITK